MSQGERKEPGDHIPIPITVPYSDLLWSAETVGAQRTKTKIRARKRKKAKDKPETRQVVCVAFVLAGQEPVEGRKG